MVRQWQELLHDKRYSHSYTDALPDFVKLAEAYGIKGIRVEHQDDLEKAINEANNYDGPVIVDFVIEKGEIGVEVLMKYIFVVHLPRVL